MAVSPAVRRLLAPALATLAVVAIAVGAVVVARHNSSPAAGPPPLQLIDTGTGAAARDAISAPAAGGSVVIVGQLPDGPGREKVRTLPDGAAPEQTVVALARSLGLTGTPQRIERGWQLTEREKTLLVSDTSGWSWVFGPAMPPSASRCHIVSQTKGALCPPDSGIGIPPGNPAPADGAPGKPMPPEQPVGTGDSGNAGGTVATGAPKASSLPLPREIPVPSKPVDADARTAARPVLDAVGLGGALTKVQRTPGQVAVVAAPVVDGLPTVGYETRIAVGLGGRITGGNGWLGTPKAGEEYPLVPAADVIKGMPVPDIARMCGDKACPQQSTEITGARLGLTPRWKGTGQQLLVPAWIYDVRGQDWPFALVAIDPKFLGGAPTDDRPGQGPAQGGGGAGYPGVAPGGPNSGNPAQVDPAPPATTR